MSKTRNFNLWDLEERIEDVEKHTYGPLARRTDIAPDFSTEEDYAKDDVVYYNGILYKFTTDHTAGAWDSTEVEETTIAENLGATGGDVEVIKIDKGYLSTAIAKLKGANVDGGKIIADFVEYPMCIKTTESGEEYDYGRPSITIGKYASETVDNETYAGLLNQYVNGDTITGITVKVDAADSTGPQIRLTNAVISLEKQEDDSYVITIDFDKVFIVPSARTDVTIREVKMDGTHKVSSSMGKDYSLYKQVSDNTKNPRFAKMMDITPAIEYASQYRTMTGGFRFKYTATADLQTVTLVTNDDSCNRWPQVPSSTDDDMFAADTVDRYVNGWELPAGYSVKNVNQGFGSGGGSFDALSLFRYVKVSDSVANIASPAIPVPDDNE